MTDLWCQSVDHRYYLEKITSGRHLTEEEAFTLANMALTGELGDIVLAGILGAMTTKGETVEEVVGFAKAMRKHMVPVEINDAVDTAGTGGDCMMTVNVSTSTALVASSRLRVAKHGNRSMSSKSGSADFLEQMGYRIQLKPEEAKVAVEKSNFVFLFAQLYHPVMKNVAPVRKTLGIRTIFNMLGPLTNPALVRKQIIGTFSRRSQDVIAQSLARLGTETSAVVNGYPSMDEVSPSGNTRVLFIKGSSVEEVDLSPEDFGIGRVSVESLRVGSPEDSVLRFLRAIFGKEREVRDFIGVNLSLLYYVTGVADDLREGYELALHDLDNSPVLLQKVVEASGGDPLKLKRLLEVISY